MKKIIGILFIVFLLAGCAKTAVVNASSNNPEVAVSILFDFDGVRVYRFFDSGGFHYVARVIGDSTVTTSSRISEGKTSRPEEIATSTK